MSSDTSKKRPFSPCVGICSATALGDTLCKGCGRTENEVKTWNWMPEEQKERIWKRLELKGK